MTNTFRPGLEFKNGKLLAFTRYSLTVMRPWPEPLARKRTTRKPFRPVRPRIPLVPGPPREMEDLDISPRSRALLQQFMAPAPPEAAEAIGRFDERQWHMMALLARCPGALDLVRSTPALAFALASNWVFHKPAPTQPLRAARRLVRLPQTAICEWLGFPARRSTVKALRKVRMADISVYTLLNLRDALRDEEAATLLRHCPVLCGQAIAIARRADARRHFTPRLLAQIPAWSEGGRPVARSWALRMLLDPDRLRRLAADRVFHSMVEVEDYVGKLCAFSLCRAELEFPPPPFSATEVIVPLATGRDLMEEAKEMQHCADDMHSAVSGGEMYLYRVLAPQRATLALVRDGKTWRLSELRGHRNAPVAPETQAAVGAWLGAVAGLPDAGANSPSFTIEPPGRRRPEGA